MNHVADGAQAPSVPAQAPAARTQSGPAAAAQTAPAQERSTGELVKLMSEQVSVLVRDELKLAQTEMTRKGKQAGAGIGMLGGGGLVALYGLGCLIACVVLAIRSAGGMAGGADRWGGVAGGGRGRGANGEGPPAEGDAASAQGGGRQRQDGRGRDQGKGAAMTTS